MESLLHRNKNACCFTGHRPEGLPDGGRDETAGMILLRSRLMRAVIEAADEGVADFYAGGARGFDLLAADAVLFLKRERPELRLHLALPSKTVHLRFPAGDRKRFEQHLAAAEDVYYASDHEISAVTFHARDRYMVDASSRVIAYLSKRSGGTFYTVQYAMRSGLSVRNLAEQME